MILLNQDPPEHTGTRHIISRGFTPRAINALEDVMTERANRIVKEAAARGAAATSSRSSRPSCRCRPSRS